MSKLSCTPKKYAIRRLVWIAILRPQSLYTVTMAFLLPSVCVSERFCYTPSPSSLYNATDSLSTIFDNLFNK